MEYDVEQLETLGGEFIKFSLGKAVWQFQTVAEANKAISAFSSIAYPYNWDPQQQDGPSLAPPLVSFKLK